MAEIKLSTLKPDPNNPRNISTDKLEVLRNSIETFPKMMKIRPIVVDEDNQILGGNMRYRALIDLGYKKIPSTWVKKAIDLTPAEKREYKIRDNISLGSFDYDMLANEWDVDELIEWGLDIPNFAGEDDDNEDETDAQSFKVIVQCGDEMEMDELFQQLTDEGRNCTKQKKAA